MLLTCLPTYYILVVSKDGEQERGKRSYWWQPLQRGKENGISRPVDMPNGTLRVRSEGSSHLMSTT